jgi:transcriptional regulator with XRE-family HTH domain
MPENDLSLWILHECQRAQETRDHSKPDGESVADSARRQARESEEYREVRDEYAAIRELRERNWIDAHIRERRYELELTQKEVARRAGTSHSFVSKVEGGNHMPTIPVLKRILAVRECELAPAPELAAAPSTLRPMDSFLSAAQGNRGKDDTGESKPRQGHACACRYLAGPCCDEGGEGVGAVAHQTRQQPLSLSVTIGGPNPRGKDDLPHGDHASQIGSMRIAVHIEASRLATEPGRRPYRDADNPIRPAIKPLIASLVARIRLTWPHYRPSRCLVQKRIGVANPWNVIVAGQLD